MPRENLNLTVPRKDMRRGGRRRQTSGEMADQSATMTPWSLTSAEPGVSEAAANGPFDAHLGPAFAPISEANLDSMSSITNDAHQPNPAPLLAGARASIW